MTHRPVHGYGLGTMVTRSGEHGTARGVLPICIRWGHAAQGVDGCARDLVMFSVHWRSSELAVAGTA